MPHAKLIATLAAVAALQGCTLARTIVHNGADLDDHRIFANRTVSAASSPSPLRLLPRVPDFMAQLRVPDEHGNEHDLERYLEDTRTAAFVVMRDDRVVYERYSRGFDSESLLACPELADVNGRLVPFEVKHRPEVTPKMLAGLTAFCSERKVSEKEPDRAFSIAITLPAYLRRIALSRQPCLSSLTTASPSSVMR